MANIPMDSDALKKQLLATDSRRGVLLASVSYEPRSVAVAETLPREVIFSVGLVYVNDEFLQGTEGKAVIDNLERMTALLKDRCEHVAVEKGSWLSAAKQLSSLKSLMRFANDKLASRSDASAYVDSTAFTRESLIVACALLRRHIDHTTCNLLHSTPQTFGSWLSRGFREIRNIMGFAGHQIPGLPTVLVVLSGFEPERASRIIDAHEPKCVLLGIGNPPTNASFLERNLKEQKVVLARQDVEKFEFPANSVSDCVNALEELIKPHLGSANIVIAPMSTKLSTLAAMVIAERHPSIQLTYCVPGEYNIASYSTGAKSILCETISWPS